MPSTDDRDGAERCGSLYPGGHGEERECVLTKGHSGSHEYGVPPGCDAVLSATTQPFRRTESGAEDRR